MDVSPLPQDRHWASVPASDLPGVVRSQCRRFWDRLTQVGLLDLYRRSARAYYGLDPEGLWKESAAVQFAGPDSEIDLVQVNHYQSIIQGILAMATQERFSPQAKSVNDDTRSLVEAPIATGLIEAYWREKSMEPKTARDVEHAIVFAEGYQHLRWSVNAGKLLGKGPAGEPMREGDIMPESLPPWRVVHDIESKGDVLEWAIVAHDESVWDVVARYPQMAAQIMAQRGQPLWPNDVFQEPDMGTREQNDDRVTVWCVYHISSDAVPEGRYALVLGDVVLYDGPALLKDEVPVYPLIPNRQMGRGWGHSPAWNMLVLQELHNMGTSALATMHEAFGTYNILTPKGSGVRPEDIGSGRRLVEFEPTPGLSNGGRPEPLPLLDLPPEAYEYPDMLKGEMQTLSGLNSVARGEPDSNLKSGAALALVQSLAVQFNSALQAARVQHLERVASGLLRILKMHSKTPRIAETAGVGANRYLREVSSDEIENVERVILDVGSPLMAQPAGRLEVADKLLDRQLVSTPEQYLEILNTGRISPLLKSPTAELELVSAENDALREGRPAVVMDTDTHEIHVREHRALLDVATRQNPQLAQLIGAHITEHYQKWSQTPQDMAALLGWKVMPPPPPMAPPGPPPPAGADDGTPKPPKGPPPPAPGRARPLGGPPSGDLPMMPTNPLTGNRAPQP